MLVSVTDVYIAGGLDQLAQLCLRRICDESVPSLAYSAAPCAVPEFTSTYSDAPALQCSSTCCVLVRASMSSLKRAVGISLPSSTDRVLALNMSALP